MERVPDETTEPKFRHLLEKHDLGKKLHIGVDSQRGLVHSGMVTATSVHDKHPLPDLLHGTERGVYDDSAYARA